MAEELGVSIATVSRALRNSHEVGEELREKVKALAKKRNYRPNPFAQSLRKEAPKMIGVVLPNLVTHYYAAVLDGIEDYASSQGYSVFSSNSHEDHNREEQAIDNFISLHVEGIIACLAQDTTEYGHFREIHDMGIPLVFFARTCLPELFSHVVANGDVAAQEATQHLIDTGSRRIAFRLICLISSPTLSQPRSVTAIPGPCQNERIRSPDSSFSLMIFRISSGSCVCE